MKNRFDRFAVVMGDIDMLRPLGTAGIPCAVVADRGALPRYSRFSKSVIEWADPWNEPELLAERLIRFASEQPKKPVLFYQSDADLLLVSRMRHKLSEYYDFVVPDAELVEELVDKTRFQLLADRLALPVPKSVFLHNVSESDALGHLDIKFPVIVKPQVRDVNEWSPVAGLKKAIKINSEPELKKLMHGFAGSDTFFIVQELVPGPESAIESYHVYVDSEGEIAGEFTGKKIRTYPTEFGQSCALVTTDATDVALLGREIVWKTGVRGLAKLDFKRSPEGKLYLLEINPRFSLWNNLGAVAGINIPLMVYCELAGFQRPPQEKARPGVRWCRAWQDLSSARREGISLMKWTKWMLACEVKPGLSLDDPLPLVGASFWRAAEKLLPGFLLAGHRRTRALKEGNFEKGRSQNNSDTNNFTDEKIKVLMITSEYPTEEKPNAAPFVARQVENLRKQGIDVDVFNFKGKKNFFNYVKAWRRLRKHTAGKQYDLMHAQWGHSAALALPKKMPWVITFRGNDLEGIVGKNGKITALGKILQAVSGMMARLADGAIVVSESLGNRLKRKDYRVIPSGLDLEVFRPMPKSEARDRLGLSHDKKLILFAAQNITNPRKRYDLAKAAVEITGKRFDAQMVVASKLKHFEIPDYMNACDVLLLTSVHEGSPNVVKEALACNLAVVSVDVGDVRKRIEGVEGCFIADGDSPEAVAAALEKALERNSRTNGRQAVEELDERDITQKVIGVYKKVLSGHRQRSEVFSGKGGSEKSPARI